MLILKDTDSLLTIITSSGEDIDVCASFVDFDTPDTFTADSTNTLITTATTTTVVGSPTGTKKRNVTGLTARNIGVAINTLTINNSDGTTVVTLFKVPLNAGEWLLINEAGVLFVYDTNGGVKMGASAASDTVAGLIGLATQADMESATSLLLAVTPGRSHFHPGVAKFVCFTTGTTTPVMKTPPSYNMTSITDTGVGRLTVTIANDFSSVDWACQATCVGISTTLTAIALANTVYIRFATMAAGTVEVNVRDATATTNALADPSGYAVCGWGDI